MIRHLRRKAIRGARLTASALILSILTSPAMAAPPPVPQFEAPAPYLLPGIGEGFHESGTASADFNNDGYPDLAFVNWFTLVGRVFVVLNNGDGTFNKTPIQTVWDYQKPDPLPAGPLVGTVLTADVNHDGNADLVTSSHFLVTVFLGKGDGTFTKSDQFIQIPHAGQQDGSLADVNNDGKLDFLVQATLGVQTFLGNGDGTFHHLLDWNGELIYTFVKHYVVRPTWLWPEGVWFPAFTLSGFDLVDLNNDGVLDMLAGEAFIGNRGYSLLGNGDGTFKQVDDFQTSFVPGGILGGDFNEDGFNDALVINEFNWPRAFFGLSGNTRLTDGNGKFVGHSVSDGARFDCGGTPIAFALADVNLDGHVDAVCSDVIDFEDLRNVFGKIVIGLGDGKGNFYPGGNHQILLFPQSPVVADFNRDGKPDIAAPGTLGISTFYVLLQK